MKIQLEQLLNRVDDYYLLSSDTSPGEKRKIYVEHLADESLSDKSKVLVQDRMSRFPELKNFYEAYGSIEIFAIDDTFGSGIFIESPDQWEVMSNEVESWLEPDGVSVEDNIVPEWFPSSIVIGYIGAAAIYFLLVTEGENVGCIYTFDHDGLTFEKAAASFEELISILAGNDEKLIRYLRLVISSYYGSGWTAEKLCTSEFSLEVAHA